MNLPSLAVAPTVLIAAFILIMASVKILRDDERAVLSTPGHFQRVKEPGVVLLVPSDHEMVRVGLPFGTR